MNYLQNNIIFLPFAIAFIATVVATPISLIFIKKLGILDDPSSHKHPAIIHTKPVPRGGGIPLFAGIIIASILFLPVTKTIIFLFLASFLSLGVGVLDDKFDISPYIRFLTNIIAALIVVGGGIGISFITNPFGGILYLNAIRIPFYFLGRHSVLPI